jgi:tRNA pseudouridine38-40 synthase
VLSPFERGRAHHSPRSLDRAVLDECAALLPGTHDFTAFTPTETDHVRFERDVMRAEWADAPEGVLAFWIEADTFMRHMVRILVGTMLAAGGGRFTPQDFALLLTGRPRSEAGETAPAHGLYLESVRY